MSKKYHKSEAKEWARQNWHGLCNVIIQSYSLDPKGYSGGPMRQPVNKVTDREMRQSREAMQRAGFNIKDESFADFFVGRHPN
jgi:hypothetical protein